MVGIYKISSPSGKIYIGQSWDIQQRFWSYAYKAKWYKQPALSASFIKYGLDAHLFQKIHILPNDVSQNILDTYEEIYIQAYKDTGHRMMNIRGAGSRGKHSQQSKDKIRNTLTGRKRPQEVIDKLIESGNAFRKTEKGINGCIRGGKAHKGKTTSEEAKKNIMMAQPTRRPVSVFNKNGELIGYYKSQHIAAERMGLWQANISLSMRTSTSHKRFWFR